MLTRADGAGPVIMAGPVMDTGVNGGKDEVWKKGEMKPTMTGIGLAMRFWVMWRMYGMINGSITCVWVCRCGWTWEKPAAQQYMWHGKCRCSEKVR